MRSHPVRLDVWLLVGHFVYFHTLCVRTAKALARLRGCAGWPEPSLVTYVISTIISFIFLNKIVDHICLHQKCIAACKAIIIFMYHYFLLFDAFNLWSIGNTLNEKSRYGHNLKPQPTHVVKRKRKRLSDSNAYKINKQMHEKHIAELFLKRDDHNAKQDWNKGTRQDSIWAISILRKLIPQTRMRSQPAGLDVWLLTGHFVYFHTSCVRTAKVLARLRGCAGSPELRWSPMWAAGSYETPPSKIHKSI